MRIWHRGRDRRAAQNRAHQRARTVAAGRAGRAPRTGRPGGPARCRRRNGSGKDIAVTQGDIDEIQLAKGAIAAAVRVVLEATGTDPATVEEVIVAGAFGTYLNVDSALDIGLLPRFPQARYRQVGTPPARRQGRAALGDRTGARPADR